jgi:peptide/nickel transport system permease protein
MAVYIGQRIALLVPVVVLVFTAVFAILHILPGDPVQLMLAGAEAGVTTPERIAQLRKSMGLDDPLYEQYARFAWHAVQGDLGESIRFQSPVNELVTVAAVQTFELSLAGMAISLAIGIPVGIMAGFYENTWLDGSAMFLALLGVSMPLFWLGLLLILLVAIHLRWLPAISGEQLRGIVLPAFTLGFVSAGLLSRIMRASLIEALRNDYIRTALSKGLTRRAVAIRHALKNALIPVITIAGLQFGGMLSGAVITETVFSRPGLGSLVVKGILWHDYPLIQGAVLLVSVSYVIVNLIVDVMYAWIDPRIRYQ